MVSILTYSENLDSQLELFTLGAKLGGELSGAAIGAGDLSQLISSLSVSQVSKIYAVSSESLKDGSSDGRVDALAAIFGEARPNVVLIASTRRGKEIASRLATRVKAACISDALNLKVEGSGQILSERLVWGGNAIASVYSAGSAVVMIPPRTSERATGTAKPEIVQIKLELKEQRIKVVSKKEKPKGQVNIKEAEVIVSAGRGFKKKEDLALLDSLAEPLNAVVGASRPLTSDLGWVPEERQVGLSGTTVKPKLYVAVGISGQIQHLTGMRDSKVIVAINNDKNAPIFQECDYGVVGDLYQVLPELTKALKTQLKR